MERCWSLEFPNTSARGRTRCAMTPRATVRTDSLPSQDPPVVISPSVEIAAEASSFEESLAALLNQLQGAVTMQYEVYSSRKVDRLVEEQQALASQRKLEGSQWQAKRDDNQANVDAGSIYSKGETLEKRNEEKESETPMLLGRERILEASSRRAEGNYIPATVDAGSICSHDDALEKRKDVRLPEIQALGDQRTFEGPQPYADSGCTPSHMDVGINFSNDEAAEQHITAPIGNAQDLVAVIEDCPVKKDEVTQRQYLVPAKLSHALLAAMENDLAKPTTKMGRQVSPASLFSFSGSPSSQRRKVQVSKALRKLQDSGDSSEIGGSRRVDGGYAHPRHAAQPQHVVHGNQRRPPLKPSRSSFDTSLKSAPSTRTTPGVRQKHLIDSIHKDSHENLRATRRLSSVGLRVWFEDWITCDWLFRAFMNCVVIINVVVLGIQAGSGWSGWILVDAFFVCMFAIELVYSVVRGGFGIFLWGNLDCYWTWFDVLLLVLTAGEVVWAFDVYQQGKPLTDNKISGFTQLRILRVARILRIMRLSHIEFFKDLGLMVVGTIGGLRTLLWSIIMLLIPVYGVAIFFTETIGTGPESDLTEHFATMRASMFTTFRCLVLGDCSDRQGRPIFQHVLETFGWEYALVYCFAALFMSFGLFNVIVAIYVESTMASAKANHALQNKRRLEDTARLNRRLIELVYYIYEEYLQGIDHTDHIDLEVCLTAEMSREMFDHVIKDNTVRSLLNECDVPEQTYSQLFEICDADGGGFLSLDEIVGGIRRLRGEPSRSDVVFVMLRIQEVQVEIHGLHVKLDTLIG